MNSTLKDLVDNLLLAAKSDLGTEGSKPSPTARKRLFDAVAAIEIACIKNGKFSWKNARCSK